MQEPISKSTPVTIGLVALVLSVSAGAIFKAGQVLTEFDYVKAGLIEMRSDLVDMKRVINQIDRRQRGEAEYPSKKAQTY